jgi:hypothetical protein
MADSLFKRGDTWYAWFYDANGKRYQRTTRQTDKRAAEATLREWERRAADPTYAAAPRRRWKTRCAACCATAS